MKVRKEEILKFFRETPGEGWEFRDLMRRFGVAKAGRSRFKEMMDDLAAVGEIRKLKGNLYARTADSSLVTGRLAAHREGYGFVTPEGGGDDIFIPARYLRENIHGDRVEVRIVAHGREGKREGRVVRTLERGLARVVGRFEQRDRLGYVVPDEQRITHPLLIPHGEAGKAEDGQVVVAEIRTYPTTQRPAEGRVVEVLGWPDDPDVEVLTVIRKYGLPDQFPPDILDVAREFPQSVTADDWEGRIDLRDQPTFTIDGETARDFDDAVSIRKERNGVYRLWVSIADVSRYVAPGSLLDIEAELRGTSVYFPDRCIPMLPEELSNGICSLNPVVERLTVTAELQFDREGEVVAARFYPSVIASSARLTYTLVTRLLVDEDPEAVRLHAGLAGDLKTMQELALLLMERRRKRGSIDFDLPEPEIVLDLQGRTEAIIRSERTIAHRIIEEFMLAANEAVAGYIEKRDAPSLYRIHEAPDLAKLSDFREFIHNFGYEFRMGEESVDPAEFQRLLDAAQGKPEERMINEMLLRSLKQARYAADNLGHFGLAAPCYTHFTSPIRRYPDLVVHRILKLLLAGELKEKDKDRLAAALPETAAHASARERQAMEAEREIVTLKKIQFMQDKVGEEFDSFITGVTPHGFFVELVELFVEGMVHVSNLPSDYYRYLEKQHSLVGEHERRLFRMGDKVRVRVARVDTERKQIDFVLAETGLHDAGNARLVGEEYPHQPVRGKRPKTGGGKGNGRGGRSRQGKRR
jgi:ribonuclease R